MKRFLRTLAVAFVLFAGGDAWVLAQTQPGPPADADKHKTTPGERYQPRLDVLPANPGEQPGASRAIPTLTAEEFKQANQIYFRALRGLPWRAAQGRDGQGADAPTSPRSAATSI